MATQQTRSYLQNKFKSQAVPQQADFWDLIESNLNQQDDGIRKSGNSPLQIQAENGANNLQRVVEFYKDFADANPAWTIQLGGAGATNSGLAIIRGGPDSNVMPVLFIDETNGRIGVNVTKPEFALDVNGTIRLGKLEIDGDLLLFEEIKLNKAITAKGGVIIPADVDETFPGLNFIRTGSENKETLIKFERHANNRSSTLSIVNKGYVNDNIEISSGGTVRISGERIISGSSQTLTISDKRKKSDILNLHYGLNEVRKLNPVSYYWKGKTNSKRTFGLIAQEVTEIMAEVTHNDEFDDSGHGWCISYNALIPVLINAIKELDQKVETLQPKHESA